MEPSTGPQRTPNILDLNNDCMRELFAVLDLSGICFVADVGARFRYIARDRFPRPFPGKSELHKVHQAGDSPDINLHRIAALFRNFSYFITALDAKNFLQDREHEIRTFKLIVRYCSTRLRELKLNLLDDGYPVLLHVRNMIHSVSKLKRLKIMRFECCSVSWNTTI